jgi:alpha-L-fucosidase
MVAFFFTEKRGIKPEMMKRLLFLTSVVTALCPLSAKDCGVECNSNVLPSEAHLRFQSREIMALVCFGLNTYTGQEWGFGNVPVSVMKAKNLNPGQWVDVMKSAEIKSVVLVAKHHDGFCLWPSKDNLSYSMAAVPAPNTGRDLIKETADACRKAGLGFGVYLSPWDRHQASYATSRYVDYFFSQWRDVMDNYGELCEIWLDGANGGSGWYGGVNGDKGERRRIPKDYYQIPKLLAMMHTKHPNAVAFGGGGNWSTAWCGNERGFSPETWWCPRKVADGKMYWLPSEADFPLRRGWYWHPGQKPKSLSQLVKAYFETVGRGAVMNIGVAPDREGLICREDARRLSEFGKWVRDFNSVNLAKDAVIKKTYEGNRLIVELFLSKPAKFECVDFREEIAKGQRISSFVVEVFVDGQWLQVVKGTTVGHRRIARFDEIASDKVRVTLNGISSPNVSSIALRPIPKVIDEKNAPAKDTYLKNTWRIVDETCKENHNAENAIDGNYKTLWHSHPLGRRPLPPPQSFTVDCGKMLSIRGFDYVPRLDGCRAGMVDAFEFYVSQNGKDWTLVSSGEFGNLAANPEKQRVIFAKNVEARFFRFIATHALMGNDRIAVAEIDLVK